MAVGGGFQHLRILITEAKVDDIRGYVAGYEFKTTQRLKN